VILDPAWAAALSLAAFVALSFYDGVVVHFFVERLPLRPRSRREHQLHTVRAVLFAPILVSFFAGIGPIAVGWLLLAVDQGTEIGDMLVERDSRAHTGGLPTAEYVAHGVLVALRAAAVAFTAVAPAGAAPLAPLALLLVPGALAVGALHVALALRPSWLSLVCACAEPA
jgi:hypothetical protein